MSQPPPSPTAMIIGTAVIALATGYMLGMAGSLGFLPTPFAPSRTVEKRGKGKTDNYDDEEESGEEEVEDMVVLDHAPNWANSLEADKKSGLKISERKSKSKTAGEEWSESPEDFKLMLVVRTDLGMTKGKIAAQCGHATLACYKSLLRRGTSSTILRRWEIGGQAKVAVQIKGEDEMKMLQAKAMSMGVTAEIIQDAGRTQIEAGSRTVLGLGPAPLSVLHPLTGDLKLL